MLERAGKAGVQKIIITGTNLEESQEAAAYIQKNSSEKGMKTG